MTQERHELKNALIAESFLQKKERFDGEIKAIFDENQKLATNSIFIFVRRSLNQFGLSDQYSEAHIINEAYCRGVEAIKNGKEITNSIGWIRRTTYNYIRELSRDRKKNCQLNEDYELVDKAQHLEDEISFFHQPKNHEAMRQAFQRLPTFERKIIDLKVIKNLSFKKIRSILNNENSEDITEASLRKRKQRALERLLHEYHAINRIE